MAYTSVRVAQRSQSRRADRWALDRGIAAGSPGLARWSDDQRRHPGVRSVVAPEKRGTLVGEGHIGDRGGLAVVVDGPETSDIASFFGIDSRESRQSARLSVVDDSEISDHDVELSRVRRHSDPSEAENHARVVAGRVELEPVFGEGAGDDSVGHRPQVRDEAWLDLPDEPPRSWLAPGRPGGGRVRIVRGR